MTPVVTNLLLIPVCGSGGMSTGPLTATLLPADLGRPRSACLRTEVGLGVGGAVVVDTADFYGRIQAVATVDGRVRVGTLPVTVDLGFEAFRRDGVIAPIAVSTTGIGAGWLGATWQVADNETTAYAFSARVALPTASGVQNRRPLAADVGFSAQHRLTRHVLFHGGLTMTGQHMLGAGPPTGRSALSGLVGAMWSGKHGGLVLDVPVSFGWEGPVDYVGITPGARVAFGWWAIELGVMVPLAGENRTLLAGDLRTTGRFR